MTQEKQLLLKDLCSRLPYGVKVQTKAFGGSTTEGILWSIEYNETGTFIFHKDSLLGYNINEDIIKPYLRPMSSMTDEEIEYYKIFIDEFSIDNRYPQFTAKYVNKKLVDEFIDWLNEHHFDYRFLIDKGLALEAPEGMYN